MVKTAVKEINILITGVGGQGVILLSELLGDAVVEEGLKIRGSEVLGMAVRGGPVFSNLRIGDDVYGPLTPTGKCTVMLAMEPSEALRNMNFLSRASMVILNTRTIEPFTCAIGQSTYPPLSEIVKNLEAAVAKVVSIDADDLAKKAGNPRSANIVMLGALFGSGKIPVSVEKIKEIIKSHFPAKAFSANLDAFNSGFQEVDSYINRPGGSHG
jgi:indolepyruvate ferredoxin oxidoreductase, beta subunit